MAERTYEVGYLLRSNISGFVAGSPVTDQETPRFGGLVKAPLGQNSIYGLVYDISIVDDGLVRQLVTAPRVDPTVIADNRTNRTVPLEISVLALGYQQAGAISHLLPPRAPLSLELIEECSPEEIAEFTGAGFGYLRHLLRSIELPVSNLLAAHVQQAAEAHATMGNDDWGRAAAEELIILLRDDYPVLMDVLVVLGDAVVGS
jgi:hypothetical protein